MLHATSLQERLTSLNSFVKCNFCRTLDLLFEKHFKIIQTCGQIFTYKLFHVHKDERKIGRIFHFAVKFPMDQSLITIKRGCSYKCPTGRLERLKKPNLIIYPFALNNLQYFLFSFTCIFIVTIPGRNKPFM